MRVKSECRNSRTEDRRAQLRKLDETIDHNSEMLLGTVPRLARVALLVNADNSSHAIVLNNVEAAAQRVKVRILPVQARTLNEIESALATMVREKAGAVYFAGDGLFARQGRQIAELVIKHRLPSVMNTRESVEDGVLMSYGAEPPRAIPARRSLCG